MPDIARLDADGVLVAVDTVPPDQHRTDLANGIIALTPGHDMRGRINGYRWDHRRGCFMPLTADPLLAATREDAALAEDGGADDLGLQTLDALIDAIAHLEASSATELPKHAKRRLADYRRRRGSISR